MARSSGNIMLCDVYIFVYIFCLLCHAFCHFTNKRMMMMMMMI